MKHARKNIFQSTNFVKPLYKKIKFHNKTLKKDQNFTTNCCKLDGTAIDARRSDVKSVLFKFNNNFKSNLSLPGLCSTKTVETLTTRNDIRVYSARNDDDMLKTSDDGRNDKAVNVQLHRTDESMEKPPVCWLRWTPAARRRGESVGATALRCAASQLGLLTTVVLWTVLWLFVIYAFEEPFEQAVSENYKRSQAELVIELATELRQITPISKQWLQAIERSQSVSRELTRRALGLGARMGPGQYWTVAGTYLFTVYVRTALGFGAPMPQTIVGRAATVAYACIAVPIHVYLMYNVSTCVASKLETYFRPSSVTAAPAKRRETDQSTGNSDAEISKKRNEWKFKRILKRCGPVLYFGYGLPLVLALYIILGAVIFGFLRNKSVIDSLMFPMQFTTTGGLETEHSHYRVIYGVYVDVAMLLIACTLAVLRARGGSYFKDIGDKYHLYHYPGCQRCSEH